MILYLSNVETKTSTKTGRTFLIGECRKHPIDKFGPGSKVKCIIFDEKLVEQVFEQWSSNNEAAFDFDMESIDWIWHSSESNKYPGVKLWYLQLVLKQLKDTPSEKEPIDIADLDIWK